MFTKDIAFICSSTVFKYFVLFFSEGLSSSQKKRKIQDKLLSGHKHLQRSLELSYGVTMTETPDTSDSKNISANKHLEKLMHELKHSFSESQSHQHKLQILTLSPYTIKETISFFETTEYMVKKSRSLKSEHGILPKIPLMSKGKVMSEELKDIVISFYESDEVSRMCPGQKDCVKVRDSEGITSKVQKRLVLGNLKEVFALYKADEKNPNIGFSTFAKLRPSYCVLAGSGGTHSVCVCTYHQNPKLQLAALGERGLSYKDLLDYSVCSTERETCMMQLCEDCPREEGVQGFLELLDSVESAPNEISYKQWVTVDRCAMIDVVEPLHEYLSSLSKKISSMVRHHFVAQQQSQYFKHLKEILPPESEAIIVGDFSENYSFIVQDAAQGYHWENSQCTVHPFVVYYKSTIHQELSHFSVCFLSPSLKHNTIMVYSFISKLLTRVRSKCPQLKKVHYFSDGCAGQYKNRYNFTNLCYHEEDFGLACEWNFFATSHGKNACDGIGGTVKRATARASLQRTTERQILTPEDMFQFCEEKLSEKIKYFFVTEPELKDAEQRLEHRFKECMTIPGTQKFHRFVPLNKEELMVYPISSGVGEKKKIMKSTNKPEFRCLKNVKIGQYVAVIYDINVWYGIVEEYFEEFDDFTVNFLHPSASVGLNLYHFPSKKDSCAVPRHHIVSEMSYPTLKGGSRLLYSFPQKEVDESAQRAKMMLACT